jgi:hypothetical protein
LDYRQDFENSGTAIVMITLEETGTRLPRMARMHTKGRNPFYSCAFVPFVASLPDCSSGFGFFILPQFPEAEKIPAIAMVCA